jgi:Transposase zinc-binding domain
MRSQRRSRTTRIRSRCLRCTIISFASTRRARARKQKSDTARPCASAPTRTQSRVTPIRSTSARPLPSGKISTFACSGHLGRVERRVMGAITACRTAALGGHVEQCDDCGTIRIAYNSCRNRHCPKCQGLARAQWLANRRAELLPVPYFHLVFTLPAPAGEIAFQNKAVVYAILFRTAAETLATIAADPRHLGAQLRRNRGPPHLGSDPSASSSCPLCRAGRRSLARWHTLGGLPARLFPARARALASVPPPVPASPAERL